MNSVNLWLRISTWSSVALLAILSLLPADEMVRTSVGGHAEHAIAYAGTGVLLRAGYLDHNTAKLALALVAYAAVLEVLQQFSPGRTPAIGDWFFSSLGAVIGITVGGWSLLIWSRIAYGVARSHRSRS